MDAINDVKRVDTNTSTTSANLAAPTQRTSNDVDQKLMEQVSKSMVFEMMNNRRVFDNNSTTLVSRNMSTNNQKQQQNG